MSTRLILALMRFYFGESWCIIYVRTFFFSVAVVYFQRIRSVLGQLAFFCHSMETAWEFNTYSSIILVGKLLFAFASDKACVHAAARSTQGSKGNAFTGGDFAAAPCPFPSCWRQPTRANRNELAGRTNKEKCVVWHS